MNIVRFGNDSFVWLLWVDAAIGLLLMLLLLATAASRHLVLPRPLYFGAALLGFLGWLAFLIAKGEAFTYPTRSNPLGFLILLLPLLPYILLVEIVFLFWFGAHKARL